MTPRPLGSLEAMRYPGDRLSKIGPQPTGRPYGDIEEVPHPTVGDSILLESGELVTVDRLVGFTWPLGEPLPVRFRVMVEETEVDVVSSFLEAGRVAWQQERRNR